MANTSTSRDESLFLPDFCERWNLLLVILIAELLAIVLAVAQPDNLQSRLRYLATASLFIQWVALTDAAMLCSCRPWFGRFSNRAAAAIMFIALQLVTLAFTLVAFALTEVTGISLALPSDWLQERLLSNGLISATVTAVALRYFYVQHQWKLKVQAEASMRIAELQARIRPHFLFNSMNTIASLTRSDPRKAEQAVEDLAEVFRATLADRNQLTLGEELELARSYVRIEELRLGERLKVNWAIEIPDDAILLPALTLQPLVENAIYHGIEGLAEGGTILIEATREPGGVRLRIRNPLPPNAPDGRGSGHHLALTNIEQRLEIMFDADNVLEIVKHDDLFEVQLHIPLNGDNARGPRAVA